MNWELKFCLSIISLHLIVLYVMAILYISCSQEPKVIILSPEYIIP